MPTASPCWFMPISDGQPAQVMLQVSGAPSGRRWTATTNSRSPGLRSQVWAAITWWAALADGGSSTIEQPSASARASASARTSRMSVMLAQV